MSAETTAKAVANEFLDAAQEEGRCLTQLQVQKMCYYSQAWWVANRDDLLFDDDIEAWKYGPVIRTLYVEFGRFGRSKITSRATEFEIPKGLTGKEALDALLQSKQTISKIVDDKVSQYVRKIYGTYKNFSGPDLINMTHGDGEPWSIVALKYGVDKRQAISPELIRSVFKAKIDQKNESQAQKN